MDSNGLYIWAWCGSAVTALFLGVAALGCDILKSLNLNGLRKEISLISGAAGLMALCSLCMKNDALMNSIHMGDCCYTKGAWMVSALTATCVGLSALGINILTSLSLSASRKTFQYIVGVAGAYSLYLLFAK